MPRTWLTADTHFRHRRIIELCNRPFVDVEAMDEAMIERWNAKIAPGDQVFHLGDFAMGDHDPYLSRLNGQKRLIRGNHDHSRFVRKSTLWHTVDDLKTIEFEGAQITLCHYALRVWPASHHGSFHFYGHSHGTLPGQGRSLDVGVDCFDFRPVAIEDAIALANREGHCRALSAS